MNPRIGPRKKEATSWTVFLLVIPVLIPDRFRTDRKTIDTWMATSPLQSIRGPLARNARIVLRIRHVLFGSRKASKAVPFSSVLRIKSVSLHVPCQNFLRGPKARRCHRTRRAHTRGKLALFVSTTALTTCRWLLPHVSAFFQFCSPCPGPRVCFSNPRKRTANAPSLEGSHCGRCPARLLCAYV